MFIGPFLPVQAWDKLSLAHRYACLSFRTCPYISTSSSYETRTACLWAYTTGMTLVEHSLSAWASVTVSGVSTMA